MLKKIYQMCVILKCKNMMHRYSFLILIIIFFVASCVKPPDYPIEPRIEFVSMNANTFDELDEDSLSVVIYFEDGDGDLGSDRTQYGTAYEVKAWGQYIGRNPH